MILEELKAAIFQQANPPPKPAPETYDYTNRYWGHDFCIHKVDGLALHMSGWGPDPYTKLRVGDYLILPSDDKRSTTRYQVETVSYFDNPKDMWSLRAVFAPRPSSEIP